MKRTGLLSAIVVTVLLASLPAGATVRSLTFEERVEAQRAIQRVYYSHMIDAHRPFAQAVPEALLQKQVRTYLEQSDALARNWSTPVTASMLEAEASRIARETRFPERLEEIRAALNGDDGLLLETLVRSTLVERLVHGFYAYDERVHGAQHEEAERLHGLLVGGTLDPNAEYPGRMVRRRGRRRRARGRAARGWTWRRTTTGATRSSSSARRRRPRWVPSATSRTGRAAT